MAERTNPRREPGSRQPAKAPFDVETALELSRPGLTAMAQVNSKVCDNITAWNKEWVTFVNRRIQEDFSLPQQLAGCRSMQDMQAVYTRFVQNAVAHYNAEYEQWGKLNQSLIGETAHLMQTQAGKVQPGKVQRDLQSAT